MADNHAQELAALRERIEKMGSYLHIDDKRGQLAELEAQSAQAGFWNDQEHAQGIMSKASALRDEIAEYDNAVSLLEDAETANELAMEGDDELEGEVIDSIRKLTADADALELSSWFDDELDSGDCIVTINPRPRRARGAGLDRDALPHVHALCRTQELEGHRQRCACRRGHRS